MAQEAPTTGTIQGTVKDPEGNPLEGVRVLFRSRAEGISSVTRSGKDGAYASEPLVPGDYQVLAEGQNYLRAETRMSIKAGEAGTANFSLEAINPGPARLESRISIDPTGNLPINGRAVLDWARLEPGVQVVDGAALDPGKAGYRGLSINSQTGRIAHYDLDEVESMDETKGLVTQNLPADSVRELIVTKAVPDVFQSLNATGSVRLTTRSGGDEWHGDIFGNYRDARAGMAGFPQGLDSNYKRQDYGFGVGGAVVKDKAFLFLGGERIKQDGLLPYYQGFPFVPGDTFQLGESFRQAYFRENMVTARLDYDWSENAKWFVRLSYDNANQIAPSNTQSDYRNQINVPAAVFGLDWNRGRVAHSGRFGYQKLVNAINPLTTGGIYTQLGSFAEGPSILGPRQTVQRDFFGRYDSSLPYRERHTLRFGGAIHYIAQGDFLSPSAPAVTSSNGIDTITDVFNDPNPPFPHPFDPRGAAVDPRNYPVGTITIFNGLGNFSEHSAFNRASGGHTDARIELYAADTFKVYRNLNIFVGVNYARDTNRSNGDLNGVSVLDEFGDTTGLGKRVSQPNWNFAPQAGLAWDPGRNGRTVVRASGGMFFDNFLWQNSYQDRISRLAQGQYARSLTLCPNTRVLFPDGSVKDTITADNLSISSLCGQPIGGTVLNNDLEPVVVSDAIQDLQAQYLAAQQAITGGANAYALANSKANFGGMLAPNFRTPRIVHMTAGLQRQMGERSMFSIDYVRQIGTQFPLGIDTNHVGDFRYLTDGHSADVTENTYQAELDAINATLNANAATAGCPQAVSAGSSSQAAVNCYITNVPGASIVDFARNGLDSSNAWCGPFPCETLYPGRRAAFGGINPNVGSNLMYFPSGRTKYVGVHATFRTSGAVRAPGIRRWDLGITYTYSKFETNMALDDGSGGDFSVLSRAEDYNRPHRGHFGAGAFDRRNMFTFSPSFELLHGARLTLITQLQSPLALSARLPQANGGGVAGEIFRSDATGDGTIGDLVPGSGVGGLGGYSGSDLSRVVANYNSNYAGRLTLAGQQLIAAQLFTSDQLSRLDALYPFVQAVPGQYAKPTWLKTMDVRLTWPFRVGERVRIEPNVAAFNVFNFANFGGAGRQLNGVLDGSPGSSLNNSSTPGVCGLSEAFCTSRLDRVVAGSGTYATGAPRQLEFGVRVTF